ncbi:asparagine synthase-related protein [Marinilabilia rubra]|uniref:Asparagine synthetase domain-containing protein n=1 Tax=Marinilabilia rubra TaxID=2162893 RepID=A0A2U2B7G3_9BACT|nr:asparagine synthase-related protein [Marinilabilia rubra]PWD98995.1 hypothetical protein DDZ16_12075 [Marinilabilia rubra]
MIQNPKISSFLEMGYFIDYPKQTINFPDKIEPLDQKGVSQTELFMTVRQKLLKAFDQGFAPGQICVVPLSGGCDSRAILGGLLQFTEASNIMTYTYGSPGSYDYEIGGQVAREIGVENIRIDLNKYRFSVNELIEVSKRMDHQTHMFFHAPLGFVEREFKEAVHWSGFLGDVIAGSHIGGELTKSLDEARERFFVKNQFLKGDDNFYLSDSRQYASECLRYASPDHGFLTFEEPLDMMNRQDKYVAPHVMLNGFEHRAPFNDPALIKFFLGLTAEQKRNQKFFYEFLMWWKPSLFDLPVKGMMGYPLGVAEWKPKMRKKWLKLRHKMGLKKDPNINYFDLSNRFIDDPELKTMVKGQLVDLQRRQILDDFSPLKIWEEHQRRVMDHTQLIQGLFSLEIHLKAGKTL